MAQWTRDQVPFPGAAFREVVELFVRRNALMDGSLRVGGREIDFATTAANVLNAMAEKDTVVPRAAAEPVAALVGRPDRRRRAAAARRPRHVRHRPLGASGTPCRASPAGSRAHSDERGC